MGYYLVGRLLRFIHANVIFFLPKLAQFAYYLSIIQSNSFAEQFYNNYCNHRGIVIPQGFLQYINRVTYSRRSLVNEVKPLVLMDSSHSCSYVAQYYHSPIGNGITI